MMVAEAWVRPDRVHLYLRPDEYHQSFAFDFLDSPWQLDQLRERAQHALASTGSVGALPAWTLSNHDVVRHATRYGLPPDIDPRTWLLDGPHEVLDPDLGLRRARAGLLVLLALPGGVYLYQGEELGLPEVWDLPTDVLDDPVWVNSRHTVKGRDGCRVPIPWSRTGPSLGFGDGPPWLAQPEIVRRPVGRGPGGRSGLDTGAVPLRARTAPTCPARLRRDRLGGRARRARVRTRGQLLLLGQSLRCVGRVAIGGDVILRSDRAPGRSTALMPDTAAWFT